MDGLHSLSAAINYWNHVFAIVYFHIFGISMLALLFLVRLSGSWLLSLLVLSIVVNTWIVILELRQQRKDFRILPASKVKELQLILLRLEFSTFPFCELLLKSRFRTLVKLDLLYTLARVICETILYSFE